jgi:hypothetical protein
MTLKPTLRRNNSFHFDNSLGTDLALEETLSNMCCKNDIRNSFIDLEKKIGPIIT